MKELTDAERLEIATRLMSSSNLTLYGEACAFMESGESMDDAIDWAIENA